MNIMNQFVLRHLKLNKQKTIITLIGIVLSMSMVTAISGFAASLQDAIYRTVVELSGDWHFTYQNINQDQIDMLNENPILSVSQITINEDGNRQIFLKMKDLTPEIYFLTKQMTSELGLTEENIAYHEELLLISGVSEGTSEVDAMRNLAYILTAIIAISSVIVISNAFCVSTSERSKQYAILKSIGATKAQIRKSVFFEGVILSAIAVPFGIAIGLFVHWITTEILNTVLVDVWDGADFRFIVSLNAVLISIAVTFLTVIVSAWLPANRIAKVSVLDAIRQVNDIKLKARKVSVSVTVQNLLGIEKTLALKSYKRNKGRYRAAIVSLVIAIVLLIGLSSIEGLLRDAINMAAPTTDTNVIVKIFSNDNFEQHNHLLYELSKLNPLGERQLLRAESLTDISAQKLADEAKNIVESEVFGVKLISIDNGDFDTLVANTLGLHPDKFRDTENAIGILVNSSGIVQRDRKHTSFQPFLFEIGDEVPMISFNHQLIDTISIGAILTEIPDSIAPDYNGRTINILVSEDVIKKMIKTNKFRYQLVSMYHSENPQTFSEDANLVLGNYLEERSFSILNIEREVKVAKNIHLLVMIFSYSFIIMLSTIGVTSVVSTIYATMALRKRELALLRSVGMTDKDMSKMLTIEGMLYGLKALFIGTCLGTALSFMFYKAISAGFELGYKWPWQSIAICSVGTFLLVHFTTAYARIKQRSTNIIDVLRQDNI